MPQLPLAVVLVSVLVTGGIDLWKFQIRNRCTLPLILSGLVYQAIVGQAVGLSTSVWGLLAGTLPLLMLYAKGGMGAGDMKLMAGVGAWMGPWFTLHVLIVSGLATGVYSLTLMFLRWRTTQSTTPMSIQGSGGASTANPDGLPVDVIDAVNRPDRRQNVVPFGAMVALGVIGASYWVR